MCAFEEEINLSKKTISQYH